MASAPAVTVRSVARTRPAAAGALLALAAVVLFGAGLRLAWNDVSSFSRADEATYLLSAQALSSDWTSYPEIVRRYIETPTLWVYPLPSRWTGIVVTAAACTVAPCTFHTLAWVETLAGIAGIALTFVLARRLFGDVAAWLAAALTAVAPIQLAMGRRALEDEVFLVAMLGALALTVEIAHRQVPSARLLTAAVVVYALAIGVKEVFLLAYPALAAVLLILRGSWRVGIREVALFTAPPLVYAVVFSLLSHDLFALVTLAAIWRSVASVPVEYVRQLQSGPAYEPLLDVYVLAPLVTVTALVSVGVSLRPSPGRRSALAIAAFAGAMLAAYVIVPKDARYFMSVDASFRLLAAWGFVSLLSARTALMPFVVAGAAALNAAVEIPIFVAVFVRGEVYDPVLANLLRALDAIPR